MAIALVQKAVSVSTSTTSISLPLTGVTANNLLIVTVSINNTGAGTPSVSAVSGGGAIWTKAAPTQNGGTSPNIHGTEIWYGTGGTGGSITVVLTLAGVAAPAGPCYSLSEFSGTGTILDKVLPANTTASTTWPAPSQTPSHANSLFVAAVAGGGTVTSAINGGYTALNALAAAGGSGFLIATDALAHAVTWTANASQASSGVQAIFAPPQPALLAMMV